ncbi:double zinc ribbon domain-containing protein [Halogeometricum limi]|uniref:Ribbon-helix-helix protein, copG family n=1 Tax=Halogeometricum limi TaxID=555875 RepID=A0A1I6G1V9_9EURY|nr:zinc ribbon domain-containing protein [Halogeometricum limi]SFR36169.1 Ribbon-helix-helix protein, copG family [Halogeometricum limi]
MSKITFRADDELVERLEDLDTSKSEVMRDALRLYLDDAERSDDADADADVSDADVASDTVDEMIRSRVDELVGRRVDELLAERFDSVGRGASLPPRDVNVNISVDGSASETPVNAADEPRTADAVDRKTNRDNPASEAPDRQKSCEKCGDGLSADDVYCANCGEKATHRVFCECGDEVRSDWAFCPGCGRRTSAADVLERGQRR